MPLANHVELSLDDQLRAELLLLEFDRHWHPARWTELLQRVGGHAENLRRYVIIEALKIDVERSAAEGQPRSWQDYVGCCPELGSEADFSTELRELLSELQAAAPASRPSDSQITPATGVLSNDAKPPLSDVDATVLFDHASHDAASVESEKQLVIGSYDVLRELGHGGMGIVYLARHRTLKRDVALKMLLSKVRLDSEAHLRFKAEAKAVAQLEFPGIGPIYENGEFEGQPYFVMSYVPGGSLADALKRQQVFEGRSAAQLLLTVTRAIAFAHQRNIIHRDLKPANILLKEGNSPLVTDFGLAKQLDDDAHDLTSTGRIMGTPSYMAPEQAQSPVDVTFASDIYSLGAILYELLTGRPPFRAANPIDTLRQVIENDPVAPRLLNPQIDQDIETICLKCLSKAPAERYASAQALAEELERYLSGDSILARPISLWRRSGRWAKKHRALTGLLLAIVVLVVTGIVGTVLAFKRINQEVAATRTANQSALRQRNLALQTLRSTVRDMQSKLLYVPATGTIRKDLIDIGLNGLLQLSRETGEDAEVDHLIGLARYDRAGVLDAMTELPNRHEQCRRELEQAQQIARRLIAQLNLPTHHLLLGNTLDRMAGSYANAGDLKTAREWNLKYVAQAETSLAAFPEDLVLQRQVALACERLGGNHWLSQEFDQALAQYKRSLEIYQALALKQRADWGAQRDVSVALERLGSCYRELGQHDQALEYFLQDLTEVDRHFAAEPKNTLRARDATVSHFHLGETYFSLNRLPEAIAEFKVAAKIMRDRLRDEPDHAESVITLLIALANMGEIHVQAQQYPAAKEAYEEAQTRARIRCNQDDTLENRQWLLRSSCALAEVLVELNDIDRAEAVLTPVASLAQDDHSREPKNADVVLNRASWSAAEGLCHERKQQLTEAAQSYQQALDVLTKFRELTGNENLKSAEAEVRTRLDRVSKK